MILKVNKSNERLERLQISEHLTQLEEDMKKVFYFEVAAGNITGYSKVNKFGNNPSLATSSTETIWDGSNAYTFPSTADITHIKQVADQAALRGETIEVQGLDIDYALVVQDAVLDATNTTTAVALTTPLRRVFRMKVHSAVVATSNIQVQNSAGSSVYGVIRIGNNQTTMAVYCVPAGKTAYVNTYYASLNKDSGGGSPDVVVKMWHQDNANGYAPQLKHLLGIDSDATSYFQHEFKPPLTVTEKTDIYMTATNLSGSATADVSGGFDLILVDN